VASYEKQIDSLVRDFVDELSEILRGAVTDSILQAATGGGGTKRVSGRKKPGPKKGSRKKKTATRKKKASTRKKKKTTTRKKKATGRQTKKTTRKKASGKRKRRSPEEIAKLEERILSKLSKKSYRPEALAKALRMPVKELHVPLGKLVRTKQVNAKGNTRAKEYRAA